MSIRQKQKNFIQMVTAIDQTMTAGKAGKLWKLFNGGM